MGDIEELTKLTKRVEAGVLGVFVNERAAFLDLLDEKSVLVSAGSKVFNGRTEYESWPLNPPGVLARNVIFTPLYTNEPDEAIVVGTYLLSGPCIEGTVNQRITVNLRKAGDDWKISLAHFSNEWPKNKPGTGAKRPTENGTPRRLQLRSENGIISADSYSASSSGLAFSGPEGNIIITLNNVRGHLEGGSFNLQKTDDEFHASYDGDIILGLPYAGEAGYGSGSLIF